MEDYLETIAALQKAKGSARVRDISKALNVKKPSVAAALTSLSKDGFVIHERYGAAQLTEAGERVARDVQKRHDVIFEFLTTKLRVDPKTAAKEACGMEHSMSLSTLDKLSKFVKRKKTSKR